MWLGITAVPVEVDAVDHRRFDHLSKSLAAGSRRSVLTALAALPLAGSVLTASGADARRKRTVGAETFHHRKRDYCLNGETIRRLRRKQDKLLAMGATIGKCPAATCAATCTTGCCAEETCQPGTTSAACGSGGATCAICNQEQVCRNQACGPICIPNGDTCEPGEQNGCCSGACCGGEGKPVCCQPG